MAEMRKLRRSWDENLTHIFDPPPPSPEGPFSEMDVTLKQIPPGYDLRGKDSLEKAPQDLDRLIRLKRDGALDEKEFLLQKKMLLEKIGE